MSTERNKQIAIRNFEEIWHKGNLAFIDEATTPDGISHFVPPGMPPGNEGFKQFVRIYRAAFPDVRFVFDDTIAEGDRVAIRWTATATHTGNLFGIPPTGKRVVVTGITINRYDADGKTVESWADFDALGMMQQLGVIPMPGQGG